MRQIIGDGLRARQVSAAARGGFDVDPEAFVGGARWVTSMTD